MKKFIPKPIKVLLKWLLSCVTWDQWSLRSWSQEGEDQILRRIFEHHVTGFYVDVGAHHPKRFSNTYLFYRNGWRGINIDAMPGSMEIFKRLRPRDINLEIGVGGEKKLLPYYIFNEPALNGFSKSLSDERSELYKCYRIIDIKEIKIDTLESILDSYMPQGQSINFMSIDVEGFDFEVIKSNNWLKYSPEFVLVEILKSSLDDVSKSEIALFLEEYNYKIFAKSMNTVFFKKN